MGAHLIDDVLRSVQASAMMFWQTLWPLVLGFGLSGLVQANVSQRSVERKLGTHRPVTVARAAAYGMASSSCSYAAAAMTKSLFKRGADFTSSLVFMFASTNLVLELGIVLVVLLGWQFAAAEYVGGVVMIVLLAAIGGTLFRADRVTEARRSVGEPGPDEEAPRSLIEQGNSHASSGHPRAQGRWIDAATFAVADLRMLRTQLLIGYLAAGVLTVMVPAHVWGSVFVRGHGPLTLLENVAVAPLIAMASFVCSIGNVPLAATLWRGGISFGGVLAFLFADLLTVPLLFVYRRFYGTRTTVRMVLLFWLVISVAALATQGLFAAAGIEPSSRATRIAVPSIGWGYTTYLDAISLVVLVVLGLLYRGRVRSTRAGRAGIDPVCGMFVDISTAPARTVRDGQTHVFCSDRCLERFTYASTTSHPGSDPQPGP
jgi:uncharacterized membrane protein YraQ (UPF0718 family)/YHS domain-containing protein